MTTAEAETPKKKRTILKLVLSILFFVVLFVIHALLSGSHLNITVSATVRGLEVVNTGTDPIHVRDLIINGRDDCSTYQVNSPAFSEEYLHKIWVANGSIVYLGQKDGKLVQLGTDRILTTEPPTLKSGDAEYWIPNCDSQAYVSAKVTTDDGTATYTFH